VEVVLPRRLVLTRADLADAADMARLTVTDDELNADMMGKIANGWPRVLPSLKSFLEMGKPLRTWA